MKLGDKIYTILGGLFIDGMEDEMVELNELRLNFAHELNEKHKSPIFLCSKLCCQEYHIFLLLGADTSIW